MRIATFKGEKTLAELVARIFPGSSRATAKRKQATDALLSANPHLSDLTQVPPGARIIVPETVLPADPAETSTVDPSGMPVRSAMGVYQRLELLKSSVPAAATAAIAEANATLAVVQRTEVQEAAARDSKLAQQVASITHQANARIQAAQALQADFLKAAGPMQAHLIKTVPS